MEDRPEIVLMMVDWAAGTMELVRSDRKSAVLPFLDEPAKTAPIKRVSWSPNLAAALVETTDGDDIAVELPTPDDNAPLAGRRVVYLDQNHWSTLARTIHAPDRVPAKEHRAATRLINLVESREVVVPLSAGHLSETGKWTNHIERKQLALTMLRLGRGWQMRDPLLVRRAELCHALNGRTSETVSARYVFTLEPNAIYGAALPMEPQPTDLPQPWALAMRSLLHLNVIVAVMLDDDPSPMGAADGWVERMQAFNEWLGSDSDSPELRRPRTNAFFFADLVTELAAAASETEIPPQQLSDWSRNRSDSDFASMPALGLYREALREKLLDPATRWEANDLQDLMHLTAAAGYADAVAGDRRTIATLSAAQRRHGRHATLHRTLDQLVNGLE